MNTQETSTPDSLGAATGSGKYDNQQIAKELRLTASGQYYYGNALYVAMDMPEIVAAPEQRHAILRYLNGTQICTDHIRLQEAAMLISPNDQAEPPPTRDVNRDSGTESANGGWLRRSVRLPELQRAMPSNGTPACL
jgi:hypothetical protein